MFKSLLRTIPALTGSVKLLCYVTPDRDMTQSLVSDDEAICHVNEAILYPTSDKLNSYGVKVNLLSDSYEWNLKDFYSIYKDTFYKYSYNYDKCEVEKLDKSTETNERDKSCEFGCKRAKWSVTGHQFEFFAPIYIDNVNDIPDEFIITLTFDNGIYKIKDKKIVIKIKDVIYDNNNNEIDTKSATSNIVQQYSTNLLYKYLYRYAVSMNPDGDTSKCILFNYNENNKGLNVSNAVYYGIDLLRGGFTHSVDSSVNSLYYNHTTLNSFDNVVSSGFERHNMVMKQILPLCFAFNISDILTEQELKRLNFSRITFSGKYKNLDEEYESKNITPNLYDFSINYNSFYSPSIIYNKDNCSINYKISSDSKNVMEQKFPALDERNYWKYRFHNKLIPNTSRWCLQSSDSTVTSKHVVYPYIINNNVAFSLSQNTSFKYGLFPDSTLNVLTSMCNTVALDHKGIMYTTADIIKYGDKFNESILPFVTFYNLILPTNFIDTNGIYNYDYYRYNVTTNDLSDVDKYEEAVKSNGFAFYNILYIKDSFYKSQYKDGKTMLDYFNDIDNVNYDLNSIINSEGIFSNVDFSLHADSSIDIFDIDDTNYNYVWSTPVHDDVYSCGALFNLSNIYNDVNYIKKVEDKYNEDIFDDTSESAITALDIASKHSIKKYIDNKTLNSFKDTKKITKFSVFVMPVMSVVTNSESVFSSENDIVLYNRKDNIYSDKQTTLTYTNMLTLSNNNNADMAYSVDNINNNIYNAKYSSGQLYTKSDIKLSDILSDENNISYYIENNSVSYIVSDTFQSLNAYSDIWCNLDDYIKSISDTLKSDESICSYFNDLSFDSCNLYYSYNELNALYNRINNEVYITDSLNSIKSYIKTILNEKTRLNAYSILTVHDISLLTYDKSNRLSISLSYDDLEKEDNMLSYICIGKHINESTQEYNPLYIEKINDLTNSTTKSYILVDGSVSYISNMYTSMYTQHLYNKDEFIPCYNIDSAKQSELRENLKVFTSDVVTEYNFVPTLKNSNNIYNANTLVQKEVSNAGNYIYKENIKDDVSVVWTDTFNLYDVFVKYKMLPDWSELSEKDKYENIHAFIEECRKSGTIKEFFCSFINKEHLKKYLNETCGDFSNCMTMYNVHTLPNITDTFYYDKSEFDVTNFNQTKFDPTSYYVYYNINKYNLYPHIYYKKQVDGELVQCDSIGGSFWSLYVCNKTAIINDTSAVMRTKYCYTRLYSYIKKKIEEKIRETYSDDEISSIISITTTINSLLKSINTTNFVDYINETNNDGFFDITIDVPIYNENSKLTDKIITLNLSNVFIVYKKDFMRVDEQIMEDIFGLSDDSNTNKMQTDIYFARIYTDSEYEYTMHNINNYTDIHYDIISESEYIEDIFKYNNVKTYTIDRSNNYVSEILDDVIYIQNNSSLLKPLYNSVYEESKKATSIYNAAKLNNIKKCTAEYKSPLSLGSTSTVCTNYRYASDDVTNMISVDSVLLNNFLNILNEHLPEDCKDYSNIYKEIIERAFSNLQLYNQYSSSSSKLLKPTAGGRFDELGLSEQNLFTYTKNGENYGFYVIGVKCNNTKAMFNMVGVDDLSKEIDTATNKTSWVFSNPVSNMKLFYSFNNIPLMEYTDSVYKVSLSGVQNFLGSLPKYEPYMKSKLMDKFCYIKTLIKPVQTKPAIKYFTKSVNYNNATENNICFIPTKMNVTDISCMKQLKQHLLARYFSWSMPLFHKVSEIMKNSTFNYIYNTKRKLTDSSLIDTGNYLSLGDTVLDIKLDNNKVPSSDFNSTVNDINKYPGISIYTESNDINVSSFNNKIDTYYEPEYKHFNTSMFFLLKTEFSIKAPNKYIYGDILKLQEDNIKKQVFKRYVSNYCKSRYKVNESTNNVPISDTEMLFLYSRYNCSIISNACGLNSNNERIYTIIYKYTLR